MYDQYSRAGYDGARRVVKQNHMFLIRKSSFWEGLLDMCTRTAQAQWCFYTSHVSTQNFMVSSRTLDSGVQISLVSDHLKNGYEGLPKYTFFPVPLQPSIALGNKVGNGISHLEKKRRKRKMRLPFELRQVEESQSINRPGAQLAYFKVTKILLGLNVEQIYVNKLF